MMFMKVKKLKEINIIELVFRNYWNDKKSHRIVAPAGMLRHRWPKRNLRVCTGKIEFET